MVDAERQNHNYRLSTDYGTSELHARGGREESITDQGAAQELPLGPKLHAFQHTGVTQVKSSSLAPKPSTPESWPLRSCIGRRSMSSTELRTPDSLISSHVKRNRTRVGEWCRRWNKKAVVIQRTVGLEVQEDPLQEQGAELVNSLGVGHQLSSRGR